MEPSRTDSPRESKFGCPRKSYLSRMNSSSTSTNDSDPSMNISGLDILANLASPKGRRVHTDSFSNVSLPDEMRISFSESEFQLDDVDFSCSPGTDVDLSSANIISVDTISELGDEKELKDIQESISSTSRFQDGSIANKQLDDCQGNVLADLAESSKSKEPSIVPDIPPQVSLPSEMENQFQQEAQAASKAWNRNGQAPQVSTIGSTRDVSDKSLVSPRRGSKVKNTISVPCQVCSDNAAGFYCGAYICEACKKFYMRAYKQDKMKYVCLRDKKCVITKESRVQCQFCRFQKCVQLNMYCPKQGEGDGSKDSSMSEIPCRVCSAPSSGFHFGAITCEGCKGFFRRMAKEREPERYKCTKKGNCEINMLTRNLCKACRYKQCLKAGMSVQGSRIGRQPNSVKHLISMELKNQVKSEPDEDSLQYAEIEDYGNEDIDIKIKDEPIDFLDSSFDTFDCGKDFGNSEASNKSDFLSSGDIVVTCVSNQLSASQMNTSQPIYNSHTDTSNSTKAITSVGSKRKLSPLQPSYGINVSENGLVPTSDYIPSNTRLSTLHSEPTIHQKPALSLHGQLSDVSLPGRVPSNQKQSHARQMAQIDQVPAVTISNHLPALWNPEHIQPCGTNTGQVHPMSSLPGSVKSHSPTRQTAPLLSQHGLSQTNQWNNGRETKNFNQNMYDYSSERETFPGSNGINPSKYGGDGGMSVISGNQSSLSDHSNAQQRHRHNSNNTSQGQLGLTSRDLSPTQPKKSKQHNRNNPMHGEEVLDGFSAQPLVPLGRAGGDINGTDENCEINMNMPDFIQSVIEAGKCLQLLNYRVFDTDLNPTASMNVDEIKNVFKMKNVDPKAGNHITSSVNMSMFASKESTWSYMMTNFHHNTYITIRFAKMVPGRDRASALGCNPLVAGQLCDLSLTNLVQVLAMYLRSKIQSDECFKTLSLNDQVKLIQNTIYPIELLNMSKVYDPVTKQYNYFTYTKEEENIMMAHFPMLRVFQEHFLHVGEMVTTFNLTDEEFALLSALLLFPAEISGLENPKAVEDLQNKVTAALQHYEESRMPDGLTRFGVLLVRVAELIQCLLQHNLAIGLLLTHNPTIKVPQLFHELIIESIKEGQRS